MNIKTEIKISKEEVENLVKDFVIKTLGWSGEITIEFGSSYSSASYCTVKYDNEVVVRDGLATAVVKEEEYEEELKRDLTLPD